ncbi:MAG: hypothetical protein IRZ16_13545 [Myxococcaceae bacterium]|nr:hypothetical protein [Myxococcaceae bacterium]
MARWTTVPPPFRLPLLGAGIVALVWGMWLGLGRMAAAPITAPLALGDHGPLMVGGFLGTVIALERAVASGRTAAYLGPLFCAFGVVLLLSGRRHEGAIALLAGSLVVLIVLVQVLRQAPALHHGVLAASGVAWAGGNLLLAAGRPVFDALPFWLVFLVGTIAAERLELTRLLPRSRASRVMFVTAGAAFFAGAVATLGWRDAGMRAMGVGELALCAWLFRYDVARRTVRQRGSVRYIGAALLAGYFWLGLGGVLGLAFGNPIAGPRYDALTHTVLVGFVFSMIFGHALVILPAVVRVRVEYRPRFYFHVGLLHASVAVRVLADLIGSGALRRAGGWGNAIALLVFIGSTALAAQRVSSKTPAKA